MRLLKEWIEEKEMDGVFPASQLIRVGENVEELKSLASERAVHRDQCERVAWVRSVDSQGREFMSLPVRGEFQYVIRPLGFSSPKGAPVERFASPFF